MSWVFFLGVVPRQIQANAVAKSYELDLSIADVACDLWVAPSCCSVQGCFYACSSESNSGVFILAFRAGQVCPWQTRPHCPSVVVPVATMQTPFAIVPHVLRRLLLLCSCSCDISGQAVYRNIHHETTKASKKYSNRVLLIPFAALFGRIQEGAVGRPAGSRGQSEVADFDRGACRHRGERPCPM